MEIKINIPQNDYVQPTEVRQEIVQDICNYIIRILNMRSFDVTGIAVEDSNRYSESRLWLEYDGEIGGKPHRVTCRQCFDKYLSKAFPRVRIRGCEMQAVFDAMWEAGYYISGEYNATSGVSTYLFTKKADKYDHHTRKFACFID